ncbi:MAG TPA: glycoside hydrolase family 140 protein, partial [Chitinophagaceae bacterium]
KKIRKEVKKSLLIILLCSLIKADAQLPQLKISANKRFFQTADGKPFFWLGDTGWLLFIKCKREDAIKYLDDRKQKGFNVIQVMLIHDVKLAVNAYGDSSIHNSDVSKPVTKDEHIIDDLKYTYWDHVDFIIDEAAKRGIYMALVPVWGGNIKYVNEEQAKIYATFLANRYKKKSNIIWLNGGDIKGTDRLKQWKVIGNTIRSIDKKHLMTFHPRGRNSSSAWFHNEPWLDFNMFQSGHRSYAQDTSANETLHYGEDNWKYVSDDYKLKPVKPTLDGEPSYEDIPYGLHKADEPYWEDYEIRRYAYWSVFAGGCGFTYGHNSVMQFYTPGDSGISFFPKIKWQDELDAPGAGQMVHLKKMMLGRSYFDRIPDQSMIVDNGQRYERVIATRAKNYAMFYVYNGRDFKVEIKKLQFIPGKARWFNPRNGETKTISEYRNTLVANFDPPGEKKSGNDWVLILEK